VFVTVLAFAVILGFIMGSLYAIPSYNIAIIPIEQGISSTSDAFFSSYISSTTIIEMIDSAESNPNVQAIILEINSPGGTVVGTKEVVARVKEISKPVVAWIREIGASGAYWIASAADKIVADPLSLTGSIGVSSAYREYSGLYQKYGITYVNLTIPDNKDIGSPYKELTEEEKDIFMHILNESYLEFVNDVAENRNLTVDYLINESSMGAIILGKDAYDIGLIDYLGGKDLAINVSSELAGIEYPSVGEIENQISIFDLLASVRNGFITLGDNQLQLEV
jgi:protease-4